MEIFSVVGQSCRFAEAGAVVWAARQRPPYRGLVGAHPDTAPKVSAWLEAGTPPSGGRAVILFSAAA
jgi:hypothetical protein